MKLDANTVQALRERIAPFDTEKNRQRYRVGDFPRADAVRDLDMRYRWDLFYAARGTDIVLASSSIIASSSDHRAGITDAHIDTALRRIVPPIGTG